MKADRLAGLAVVALAALALTGVADEGTMQPGAILFATLGITGLVVMLRARLR